MIPTVDQIEQILEQAQQAGRQAADQYFEQQLGGQDQYACGFAWITIHSWQGQKLKGNTKLGRAMKAAGIEQNYNREFQIWNPSGHGCQNVETKECGARAAAQVFRAHGFEAYAGSRLD